MSRTVARAALALSIVMPTAAGAQAPAAWHGDYVYEHGASTGTSVEYRLQLGARSCRITAQGFQTDEVILCRAAPRPGNQIEIGFLSFGDGAATNAYGVQPYRVGERLFSLANRRGAITTGWGAYTPFENRRPTGRYFRRAR